VTGIGGLVSAASGSWRRLQSGFVRSYAVGVLAGAALLVAYVVVRSGGR
jgi:NADH-quinone oxidoreductase subunit L